MSTLMIHMTTILMLLVCNTKSDTRPESEKDSIGVKTIRFNKTEDFYTASIDVTFIDEKAIQWKKTFSNNSIGFIQTGDSVSKALDLLKNEFRIEFDSIQACEGCEDDYEHYYSIYNESNDLIFTIHPGLKPNSEKLIFRFVLYDSSYKSDKGIGIGNTVIDLKEKYNLTEVYFSYHLGLLLFVEGFDGSFCLDYKSYSDVKNFNFEQPTIGSVPEKSTIKIIEIR